MVRPSLSKRELRLEGRILTPKAATDRGQSSSFSTQQSSFGSLPGKQCSAAAWSIPAMQSSQPLPAQRISSSIQAACQEKLKSSSTNGLNSLTSSSSTSLHSSSACSSSAAVFAAANSSAIPNTIAPTDRKIDKITQRRSRNLSARLKGDGGVNIGVTTIGFGSESATDTFAKSAASLPTRQNLDRRQLQSNSYDDGDKSQKQNVQRFKLVDHVSDKMSDDEPLLPKPSFERLNRLADIFTTMLDCRLIVDTKKEIELLIQLLSINIRIDRSTPPVDAAQSTYSSLWPSFPNLCDSTSSSSSKLPQPYLFESARECCHFACKVWLSLPGLTSSLGKNLVESLLKMSNIGNP